MTQDVALAAAFAVNNKQSLSLIQGSLVSSLGVCVCTAVAA